MGLDWCAQPKPGQTAAQMEEEHGNWSMRVVRSILPPSLVARAYGTDEMLPPPAALALADDLVASCSDVFISTEHAYYYQHAAKFLRHWANLGHEIFCSC